MSDVWAPWKEADPSALQAVFDLPDFTLQVRALLDLSPKVSVRDLQMLPWEEPRHAREFRIIRDAWAGERAVKREQERERDELPLPDVIWDKIETAARIGAWKDAKEAFELMKQIAGSSHARKAQKTDDDFARLTDTEVLALGALLHKLRDEPLTQFDENVIAYIAMLDTKNESGATGS